MQKIVEVKLEKKDRNYEKRISKILKGEKRRFEYAFFRRGSLYLVFSPKEMKLKTVVKQFDEMIMDRQIKKFLSSKQFDRTHSVWRVVGRLKCPSKFPNCDHKWLVFFEKALDN